MVCCYYYYCCHRERNAVGSTDAGGPSGGAGDDVREEADEDTGRGANEAEDGEDVAVLVLSYRPVAHDCCHLRWTPYLAHPVAGEDTGTRTWVDIAMDAVGEVSVDAERLSQRLAASIHAERCIRAFLRWTAVLALYRATA